MALWHYGALGTLFCNDRAKIFEMRCLRFDGLYRVFHVWLKVIAAGFNGRAVMAN
jgi:hypothetical protein